MPATSPSTPADSAPNTGWKPELHEVPVDAIAVSGNVRAQVGDIVSLIDSVKTHGVISPIRVADIGAGQYELIYGQRRLAAAKAAGLATIPAIVDAEQPAREDRAVDQLIENLQREDLNALDMATAYRWLLDKGLTQRQLGERLGVAQPTIANTLALLKAPDELQAKVAAGELTRSHVEAIVKLPKSEQAEVARRAVEHGLSVAGIEGEIRQAEQRRGVDDRRRDAAANRAKELLAGWLALLLKKKADPETVTLVGWNGIPSDGLEALAKQGWQRSQTASRGADQAWRSPAPKGFCDCNAYELTYRIDWKASGEVYHPQVHSACIVKKHQAAADKAERKVLDAQQAEAEVQRQAEAEAHAAAIAPVIERLTADPELRARVVLWSLVGGTAWGETASAFYGEVGRSWQEIAPLPAAEVERWTVAILADDVADAPDVLEAFTAPAKPKRSKATVKGGAK